MAGLENPHQTLTGLDFRRNADTPPLSQDARSVKLFPPSERRAG